MTAERRPGDLAVLAGVAGLRLALHVATAPGYGIFRDELYYLACADHLDFGYVDHPPLSIARRFLPGVAGAVTVFLTGLVARELGGGRAARSPCSCLHRTSSGRRVTVLPRSSSCATRPG